MTLWWESCCVQRLMWVRGHATIFIVCTKLSPFLWVKMLSLNLPPLPRREQAFHFLQTAWWWQVAAVHIWQIDLPQSDNRLVQPVGKESFLNPIFVQFYNLSSPEELNVKPVQTLILTLFSYWAAFSSGSVIGPLNMRGRSTGNFQP